MRQRHGKGRKKASRPDKVIHVVFGPGGGRVERGADESAAAPTGQANREPISDLFTLGEIARLLRLTPTWLRTLDRFGLGFDS